MKYRKKPIVVDAFRLTDEWPDWVEGRIQPSNDNTYFVVETLEGPRSAYPDEWIVKGIVGEIYPVKPDIFEKTYERVDE